MALPGSQAAVGEEAEFGFRMAEGTEITSITER